jgi:serine/threonine protein kinase/tetratricopeptide (TPR) repeat protein
MTGVTTFDAFEEESEPGESAIAEVLADVSDRVMGGEPIDVLDYSCRNAVDERELDGLIGVMNGLKAMGSSGGSGGSTRTGASEPPLSVGVRLGDYRLERVIGRGGMGFVYRAVRISTEAEAAPEVVAVKVLRQGHTADDRARRRFDIEAQAAELLSHPNIVPVLEVGSECGTPYYVMPLIEGLTVAELILRLRTRSERSGESGSDLPSWVGARPDRYRMIARLGMEAASALQHAHEQRVVHRDVKPANMLIEADGRLKVADFGLARLPGGNFVTGTGDLLGTPAYMSPEQARGGRAIVDHRTDIYSLGITLYELIALRPAFPDSDRKELLRQIIHDEPPRLDRLAPDVPRDLQRVVEKAMSKDASLRYSSAVDFADDLQRFLDGKPVSARRPGAAVRFMSWGRRNPALACLAALFIASCLIGTFVSWRFSLKAVQREHAWREQYALLLRNLDAMLAPVGQSPVNPTVSQPYRKHLDGVRPHLQRGPRYASEASLVTEGMALSERLLGDIARAFGKNDEAAGYYADAERRLEAAPDTPESRRERAAILVRRASVLRADGAARDEAKRGRIQGLLEEAVSLRRGLAADHPHDHDDLEQLSDALCAKGHFYQAVGRLDEADAAYDESLRIRETIARLFPERPECMESLANHHADRGNRFLARGDSEAAVRSHREAARLYQTLADRFPGVRDCIKNVILSYKEIIWDLEEDSSPEQWDFVKDAARVEEFYASTVKCLDLLEALKRADPSDHEIPIALQILSTWGRACVNLRMRRAEWIAFAKDATGKDGASQDMRSAEELLERMAKYSGKNESIRHEISELHLRAGRFEEWSSRPYEAERHYRAAINHAKEMIALKPNLPQPGNELVNNAMQLAGIYELTDRPRAAHDLWREVLAALPPASDSPISDSYYEPCYLRLAAVAYRSRDWLALGLLSGEMVGRLPNRYIIQGLGARALARSAGLLRSDERLPQWARGPLAEAFAVAAVSLLRVAISDSFEPSGFVYNPKELDNVSDFDPIRDSAAFKRFIAECEDRLAKVPEGSPKIRCFGFGLFAKADITSWKLTTASSPRSSARSPAPAAGTAPPSRATTPQPNSAEAGRGLASPRPASPPPT